MALQLLALRILLVLVPLLAAQGLEENNHIVKLLPKKIETCQRPQLAPDQDNYKKNEEMVLSCPEGLQPSFTHARCWREFQSNSNEKSEYREVWLGKDSRGQWKHIWSKVECIEVLQVDPGTLEVSSTSIQVNWTCRAPEACSRMRATCRLAGPSSPPCEAEEVPGEEMLHGQEGTFSCPALQPFTEYSVTISLPPSTILFTWLLRRKEMVPDKPEQLWLDPSTGSLSWEPLPSCKGEIIGYQLSITARRAHDGSVLESMRVLLDRSVARHTPTHRSPASKSTVSEWGLARLVLGLPRCWSFNPRLGDPVVRAVPKHPSRCFCRVILPELRPYENFSHYCMIKEMLPPEEDAGKGVQAGELLPQSLPVLESSGSSEKSEDEDKMW
ncbi:uncharacterized protein LOC115601055 [Strigops habroptila]|uniref:uncharacterized protein LOC115601055 n=1 Tax=Strigops habroptila TaxID=2489341 RepID=UPI0011D030C0|nr:uncharacterized protein LOC115601055 [Strigops habroptila]